MHAFAYICFYSNSTFLLLKGIVG